jgi:formate dehydrogenase subunit gamma
VAIGLFFSITGHVMFALRDPDSLRSMWVGTISRAWARTNAPRWLEEVGADDDAGRGHTQA